MRIRLFDGFSISCKSTRIHKKLSILIVKFVQSCHRFLITCVNRTTLLQKSLKKLNIKGFLRNLYPSHEINRDFSEFIDQRSKRKIPVSISIFTFLSQYFPTSNNHCIHLSIGYHFSHTSSQKIF